MSRPLIIAVDGPAAAGKGTISRRIAEAFGLAHLDTGSLYRAVAARVLGEGRDPAQTEIAAAAAKALTVDDLARPNLRDETVGKYASVVAALPAVRGALLAWQREFAHHPPKGKQGAVLDGRDIGTVVCPDATVKLFVTASVEERARRRILELRAKGEAADAAKIEAEIRARDERDMNRPEAPLRPASDAHLLDTTELDIDAAFAKAKGIIAAQVGLRPAGGTPETKVPAATPGKP
ncbi:MAG: (d)CMP kinase [Alphaproteobacteria bacterium]|nr:(d)CMP kinase [Alphaproteobacteria bacterium]